MRTHSKLKSRWRWPRRIAFLVVFIFLILLAIPFIFTTQLARYYLAHSAYARFSPQISLASLSPSGELALHDLSLSEPDSSAPLASVRTILVTFSFLDVIHSKIRTIEATGVSLHLRQSATSALTLLQLANSESSPAPPPAAPTAAAPTDPFWCDSLNLHGELQLDPFPQFQLPAASYPFHLKLTMHGSRSAPTRDFALGVGQILAANLTLDSSNLTAQVDLRGFTISTLAGAKNNFNLANAGLTAAVDGPLSANFLQALIVHDAKISFDSFTYGSNQIQQLASPFRIARGELAVTDLHATFDGGDLTGLLRYSLTANRLLQLSLHIAHLDQHRVANNLAPDRFDAEGAISGSVELAATDNGHAALAGSIELTSDAPGRLHIKDEKAAAQLAQTLQNNAAPGILPANFNTIVIAQLEDYPYTRGHITVTAPDGVPVVTLNYTRAPVAKGEPGAGIQTTVAGRQVIANYTVQLPGLSVVLKGETIEGLLALATGLEKQIAGTSRPK